MKTEHELAAFLHFGYLPKVPEGWQTEPWAQPSPKIESDDIRLLAKIGAEKLRFGFADVSGSNHIVPLSGGLDSRAILAFLLEAGLHDDVVAITFGADNLYDYEIAQKVGRATGVRHELIDLTTLQLTQSQLEDTAREVTNWTYLLDSVVNRVICNRFGRNATYWSGYMGDPLDGSQLFQEESATWQQALRAFARSNHYARSIKLTPEDFHPENALPQSPFLPVEILGYDDQINFVVRQESCIRPLVLPKGYDYRTPFLSPEWVHFILGVPRQFRFAEQMYRQVLPEAFPDLFALPVKNNLGLTLNAPRWRYHLRRIRLGVQKSANRFVPQVAWPTLPTLNYLDLDRILRQDGHWQDLFYTNLRELSQLDAIPWLDIEAIWQQHQKRQANHSFALRVLLSLAVYLKVR
ncbi:MAG: 7-cyano-7-deazaguanine synthase [Anaerolineae bacterium]|nr:7-cyano-7-deazaguanine synthase [Anaerolineae bacterium]